jgi:hypothetical protein
MESNSSPGTGSKTGVAYEYFLYAAILVETALAALIYKVIFRDADLGHLRIYFSIFYFAFLGWSIAQLNALHRRRKSAAMDQAQQAPATASSDRVLGLTKAQLVVIIVAFATAVAAFSWALRTWN